MSSVAERRKFILDKITEKGFVKVADLADVLHVTQTTIRKDLTFLERQGVLHRAYGSALVTSVPILDINLNTKRLVHFKEKQKIAQAAVKLVEENDSIIISAGSTMAVFTEYLSGRKNLNVVTPAVNVAMLLGDLNNITVMQLGGILYGNSMCVTGSEAIDKLDRLHCSKVFFGVDGFDPEHGVTCATTEEAAMTYKMMEVSNKSIVLADSSKIGFRGFGRICRVDEVDILITDSGISHEQKRQIEKAGVKIIIAQE